MKDSIFTVRVRFRRVSYFFWGKVNELKTSCQLTIKRNLFDYWFFLFEKICSSDSSEFYLICMEKSFEWIEKKSKLRFQIYFQDLVKRIRNCKICGDLKRGQIFTKFSWIFVSWLEINLELQFRMINEILDIYA